VHLLYALASYALFLLGLPVLLTHPKLRHGVRQRLGFYAPSLEAGRGSPRIWLHGASAGDLLSLQPMMKELKARQPGCCIIVSTMTNSGQGAGKDNQQVAWCRWEDVFDVRNKKNKDVHKEGREFL